MSGPKIISKNIPSEILERLKNYINHSGDDVYLDNCIFIYIDHYFRHHRMAYPNRLKVSCLYFGVPLEILNEKNNAVEIAKEIVDNNMII